MTFHGVDADVESLGERLVQLAERHTVEPEVTVDVDGALAFDLRLKNGDLMFAELEPNGVLSVTVLNEHRSVKEHISPATEDHLREMLT